MNKTLSDLIKKIRLKQSELSKALTDLNQYYEDKEKIENEMSSDKLRKYCE